MRDGQKFYTRLQKKPHGLGKNEDQNTYTKPREIVLDDSRYNQRSNYDRLRDGPLNRMRKHLNKIDF